MTQQALAVLTNARKMLAEARTLADVKHIRDVGHGWLKVAKSQRDVGLEARNDAAEIVLIAERRIGEILAEREPAKTGPKRKKELGNAMLPNESLEELGITKMQSSRWQAESRVPEEEFREWVDHNKAAGKELTSTALVKLGRQAATPIETVAFEPAHETGIVGSLSELIAEGKKFGTIYADPPWQYGNQATRASTDNHYQTMSLDAICAEPVTDLAADDAHLHLWTTNAFLFDAKRVIEAWGFVYKSCFVWVKPQMGIGNYWRVSHEFLLFGLRGKAKFRNRGCKSWGEYDRGEHSKKPDAIRAIIESASPGPRLEMYGRKAFSDWTVYGNQVENDKRLFA